MSDPGRQTGRTVSPTATAVFVSPDADIATVLRAEIAAVERFVVLLQTEQLLLQSADTDDLTRLAGEKSALTERLVGLGSARNERLARAGFGVDREGLQGWAGSAGAVGASLQQRLVALAAAAADVNRLNGQLIAMRINHNQAALAALTQDSGRNTLYSCDGQARAPTGYRIIDSA